MVLCLLLCYLILYFAVFKGVESTGKIAYVTAPLPYVLLFVLLFRACALEGAGDGIAFLFIPKWERLGSFQVWRDAVN
jgi:SNF family Na+-dependent transporter